VKADNMIQKTDAAAQELISSAQARVFLGNSTKK
jgi:hypothetical protein